MENKSSVKLSKENKYFLKKLGINRIKLDMDKRALSYSDLMQIIRKYFKLNNDRYLELVKSEVGENV